MKQERSTGPVRRNLSYVVLLLAILTFAAKPALAQENLFGPEDLGIGWLRIHLSFHKFTADEPGEGVIIISKNTPEKKIRGGFARLNGEWIPLESFLRGDTTVFEKRFNFRTRNYLVVWLRGDRGASVNVEVRKKILTPPPEINFSAYPTAIKSGEPSELTWQVANAETVEIEPDFGMVEASGSLTVTLYQTTTYILKAEGKGGTATSGVTLTVYQPPIVNFSADPETVIYGETTTLSWSATNADEIVIDQNIGEVSNEGSLEVKPDRITTYTITAGGLGGSAQAQAVVTVKAKVEPQPEGSFGEQYEDLIPPDATIEAYDSKRFSVVTGLVCDVDGMPIADVSVTLHNHAECGTGFTDGEGRFSLPVEGGGTITVVYQKEGLIPAHRKVYVPWNDIAVAETIQMISEDPASTTIAFDGNPSTVVTHQSTEVSDESGTRSCSMVFTGDNRAYEVDAQGTVVRELSEITTRATEFSTPESMPAKLPPTSAYTYCVELSVDGVDRVKFDKPVVIWVDNFLGFDLGEIVPVGYYDRDKGAWVPSDNGLVVRLLDTDSDGIVDALDANGDDQPDDLSGDGFLKDEVSGLGDVQRYVPGSTYWRFTVSHFSARDGNFPAVFPQGATASTATGNTQIEQQKVENLSCPVERGSFVEEKSRIFHEDIAIPGTQLTLHYESDRVPGYGYKITVPASGDTVPASLKRIIVRAKVAGRTLEQTLDPLPNQIGELIWDGLDYLGRPVTIPTTADISVGYVYDGVYSRARNVAASFGQAGIGATAIRTREELIAWKRDKMVIRRGGVRGLIAEGWTVSLHHQLSPIESSTLHKGDGGLVRNYASIISTLGGNGIWGYGGDGGPATEASIKNPSGMTVDASGNVYFADGYNGRVRKIDTNGTITTVAGGGNWGEDIPATEGAMRSTDVACDGSGNLYISDNWSKSNRIWKVDQDGILRRVAGVGAQGGYSGDGGPARDALLNGPCGVAVDAEGNIYFGDSGNDRIRKVDTSGIITTVAGNGIAGFSGDGGPAIQARINEPTDVEVDGEGNLYIADKGNHRIRKVDTSGIITTVAGGGSSADRLGDGGPATEAELRGPHEVAVDISGNLYIADGLKNRIRKVDTRGIITTVAGTGIGSDPLGDGGPATQAGLLTPNGVALDSLGNIYIADTYHYRIRKVSSPLVQVASMEAGDFAFAEGNGLGHILDSSGRHLRTVDLNTGVSLYEFGYDAENRLISIIDQFSNETIIERDGNGVPTAIVSPDGITTTLTIDGDNHLTRITYPDGGHYDFEYSPGGLMTLELEPRGNRFAHIFDAVGRLAEFRDEEAGRWTYNVTAHDNGNILTEVLSSEGNLTSYSDNTASTGAYTSTITDSTGAQTLFSSSADGLTVSKSLACGLDLDFKYSVDSRYKYQFAREMTETTPGGLTKDTVRDKTYQDTDSNALPDLITENVTVNGKLTTLVTDTLQGTKTVTSPAGRTVTTSYDANSLLTTSLSIPGLYDTDYGYDARGRLSSISTNTRRTTFAYDAQGNLASVTDPEYHTTTYAYDAVGRMTEVGRPDGSSLGFTYDKNGNMTALTNPANIDHGFSYNLVNLNSSYTTPLSGSYSYVYDKDRRLKQVNFPSGKQIANIYANGRLEQIQTPEGNIDFTYLCGSKVDTIKKDTEGISYGYDGSLVTAENLNGTLNESLNYTYNNDFNLTAFTYAGGTVGYTYDNDGLLTSSGVFTVSRHAGNGLPEAVTGGALSVNSTFNGYGEVEAQDFTVGSQGVTSWSLTRDNVGRITSKTENVAKVTSNYIYSYDPMGRLLTVTKDGNLVEEYQYDRVGTRTYEMNLSRGIAGRTFTYDDEDHLLTVGDAAYQYDLDGYLTTKTIGTEPPYEVTAYSYSSRGELLSVSLPDGSLVEYIHDPLGRRIAEKANGVITEKYLWQGLTRLLAVYDGSDNLLMRFLYADSRMPVAMEKGAAVYYLSYDQVGSLRVVADGSGNVVKRIDYDSFGNVINDTNPSFDVLFGFAGGLHDRDTGLVRFGFRDYDPDTGRWTAKDPIGFLGGDIDLYGYCLNDPINLVDPEGLLTPRQKLITSLAGALGSTVGTIVGTALFPGLGSAGGAAIGSALFSALAASLQGGTPCEVLKSAVAGAALGYLGANIGAAIEAVSVTAIQAAARTGAVTGVLEATVLGASN